MGTGRCDNLGDSHVPGSTTGKLEAAVSVRSGDLERVLDGLIRCLRLARGTTLLRTYGGQRSRESDTVRATKRP